MTLRDRGWRNFREMGRREADAAVEVAPERGQPNQSGRAGDIGVDPSSEDSVFFLSAFLAPGLRTPPDV